MAEPNFFDTKPNFFDQQDPSVVAENARHHAGQVASNFGRVAANTFGVGDNLAAGWRTILPAMYPSVFGGNASGPIAKDAATMGSQFEAAQAEERAKTAKSNAALGPVGSVAANVVGGLPAGYLGMGAGATRALAPTVGPWIARMIGGAGEGLGMNLLGGAGRGESPSPVSMLVSTLLGAGFNSLGGRPAGGPPKMPARDALETAKATALTNLQAPRFDPAHVDTAVSGAEAALTPDQRFNLSPRMKHAVADMKIENTMSGAQSGTSAATINGFARKIFQSVRNADDNAYAAKIRDNLTAGPQSVLATAPTMSGHPVGEAAKLNADFNMAHARLENHDWLANASIDTAPAEAANALKKDSGYLFDKAGRESVQTLADLAPKKPEPSTNPVVAGAKAVGSSLWGDLSNKAIPAVMALSGFPASAAAVSGVKAGGAGIGAMWNAGTNAAKQRAIDAAQMASTSGIPTKPMDMQPAAPVRRFIGALGAGPEANPPDPWAAYSP
jgi:hypothetical protein